MTTTQSRQLVNLTDDGRVNVTVRAKEDITQAVLSFIDMAITATDRATHYNTQDEQNEALEATHQFIFEANRGLYGAIAVLPGMTNISKRMVVTRLLNDKTGVDHSLLTTEEENKLIIYLAQSFKPTQLLRLFDMLRENRVNNKSTRRLILKSILSHDNFEFWAVKYRTRIHKALQHAWGVKTTTWIKHTLAKSRKTADEKLGLMKYIDKYTSTINQTRRKAIHECVSHILGNERNYSTPILKAFYAAREDLTKGSILPTEVLEGIRSVYHPNVSHAEVINISKRTMSETEKMKKQRSAKKQGVTVEFNPLAQDIVDLYIYALEEGSNAEIFEAMQKKAYDIAQTYPMSYQKVSIIVDTSKSMFGDKTQKRRPMAISLAMRDVLSALATEEAYVFTTNGEFDQYGLIEPEGDTSMAEALINALEKEPDIVYVITDGYENASAGRFNEVLQQVRQMGITTPVQQVTPVAAAEAIGDSGATRKLSDEIEMFTVSKPSQIGMSAIRACIAGDIEQGILSLLEMAKPLLENR